MKTNQLASGLIVPVTKKEPKKELELLEIENDEYRKELARMFSWMVNYPCSTRGIVLEGGRVTKQIQEFRKELVYDLAKKLLGTKWSCEELC